MTELRGIRAQIVVGEYGTCVNGGISERVREVTIVAQRDLTGVGPAQDTPLAELPNVRRVANDLLPATDEAPAVVLVKRHLSQGPYYHVESADPCPADRVGYMAGGSTVAGSIIWVLTDKPTVSLHDRSETTSQYRLNI